MCDLLSSLVERERGGEDGESFAELLLVFLSTSSPSLHVFVMRDPHQEHLEYQFYTTSLQHSSIN